MTENFRRDPISNALINTDDGALQRYKTMRTRLKKSNNLEQRVTLLEQLLLEVIENQNACSK